MLRVWGGLFSRGLPVLKTALPVLGSESDPTRPAALQTNSATECRTPRPKPHARKMFSKSLRPNREPG